MRTAVIITGHMRTFDRCLPTLHWHILRHFGDVDFYVATVQDDDTAKVDLLRFKYPKAKVEVAVVAEQPDCVAEMRALGVTLPKQWTKGQAYTHEPYAISVPPQAVLRQLWQLQQGWKLFEATCGEIHVEPTLEELKQVSWTPPRPKYDWFIRCRPDLYFQSAKLPIIGDPTIAETLGVLSPWWGRFGGINDRFALMRYRVYAEAYFTAYSQIPALAKAGCPIHPESLIRASFETAAANLDRLDVEFGTLRSSGEMRPPEISASDIAHRSRQP